MEINKSGFYIHNIKRLGQCLALFKSESEVRLVLCYLDGTITVSSLLLANVALLHVVLQPTQSMDESTILLQTEKDTTRPTLSLYLSTTMLSRALSEANKFNATYCVLYPSEEGMALVISSFDARNREMSTLSVHHLDPQTDMLDTLPPIERCTGQIEITRPARVLSEYFGTNAHTEITTGPRRLIWTTKDTLLTTRYNLYCTERDRLDAPLVQTFPKGIMVFIKQFLLFLGHMDCTLTLGTDQPLHVYNPPTSTSGLSVDLISGYMEEP